MIYDMYFLHDTYCRIMEDNEMKKKYKSIL